jgi:squalene-hopene/tetraprenyl-beta-curcumene cyclase
MKQGFEGLMITSLHPLDERALLLVGTQRDDGTWDEPYYTGTGFPGYGFGARLDFRDRRTRERIAQGTELQRGFMINYNLYRHYFPLMALGRARQYLFASGMPPRTPGSGPR